jgi:hypothetical protein
MPINQNKVNVTPATHPAFAVPSAQLLHCLKMLCPYRLLHMARTSEWKVLHQSCQPWKLPNPSASAFNHSPTQCGVFFSCCDYEDSFFDRAAQSFLNHALLIVSDGSYEPTAQEGAAVIAIQAGNTRFVFGPLLCSPTTKLSIPVSQRRIRTLWCSNPNQNLCMLCGLDKGAAILGCNGTLVLQME